MSEKFNVGDRVRLVDEAGDGSVSRIDGNEIWVSIDGFDMPYSEDQLVKVEFDDLVSGSSAKMTSKDKKLERATRDKLSNLGQAEHSSYELDLHIEELLDRHEHMSNSEILNYQMSKCKAFVHEALEKRYPKIILIHGVGEGVLKQEIHHWLHGLDHIEFHDAPYRTYGYGATEVLIRR